MSNVMNSNAIDSIRTKAENYVDMGNLLQAEKAYREILTIHDRDADANYMLGVLLAEKGDVGQATEFLNKAISLNPDYPDSYFILARIQQVKEEYQSAFENCLKATSLDPEFDEAWLLLCSLSTWLRNDNQASKSCQQAVKYYPDSAQALSNLAAALFNLHKYSEAAEAYKIGLKQDPENISVRKFLCLSLIRAKVFNEAVDIAKQVIDVNPDNVDFYNYLCEAYLGILDIDNAECICNKALEMDASNVDGLINMGNVLQKRHQYDNAVTWYRKALDMEPDNANIYHNLGISSFRMKDNATAAKHFRKAIELNPGLSVSKHMLSVAEGTKEARADNDYVTDLFDEYAHRYDEHQKDLKYQVPVHVNDAIRALYADNYLDGKLVILDLGCGTGLCAPYLDDISQIMVGVDLSPDMIKRAEKLGLYQELIVGDMSECMDARPDMFDLALAGDVFVYVGDLDKEFRAAKGSLKQEAFFVFTVQVNDDADSYELTDTGRYNHADTYISELIDKYAFRKVSSKNIISRVDYGIPVNSRVYVLQNNKM